jgi:lipopolysaccharide export system permease protein
MAILRTKPTFALKPQIINAVKEGQLYLRADQIDQEKSGSMRGVTIFDVSDASRRRSIYADSGTLSFAANRKDLVVHLYRGMMMSAPTDKPGQLSRIYYQQNIQKVREVANSLEMINADSSQKGEREMSVCEMQEEFEMRDRALKRAYADSLFAAWRADSAKGRRTPKPAEPVMAKAGGIGAVYCTFITRYLKVKSANAAELPARPLARQQQDSAKKKAAPKGDSVYVLIGSILKKVPRNKIPAGAFIPETVSNKPAAGSVPAAPANVPPAVSRPMIPPAIGTSVTPAPPGAAAVDTTTPAPSTVSPAPSSGMGAPVDIADAKLRLDDARHWRNRYGVEIQKKFSLAFACIVFVLVGAPIALRFPRGGVGLVMGVGFTVFAIYYIGLIGGESLANKNIVSPFWAMWIDNIVFLLIGLGLIAQMGNENTSQRGGQFSERVDAVRLWFQQRRGGRA